MSQDNEYEENPWDDEPILGQTVYDLLPPSEALKHAVIRVVSGERTFFSLPAQDVHALEAVASRTGLSPEALLAGILHDFLHRQRGDRDV